MASVSPRKFLFVGPSGAGKSTLLNSKVGRAVFPSGLSFGGGKTLDTMSEFCNGDCYVDTMGLGDGKDPQTAAKQLTVAVKDGGNLCIVFVVCLTNLRVRGEHCDAVKLVLAALPKDMPFSIIINQIKEKSYKCLQDRSTLNTVVEALCPADRMTNHVYLYPYDSDLAEADAKIKSHPSSFLEFLDKAPQKFLLPSEVGTVEDCTARATLAAQEAEAARLEKERVQLAEQVAANNRRAQQLAAAQERARTIHFYSLGF